MAEQQETIIAVATMPDHTSEIQTLTLRAQDLSRSVDWWNMAIIWALVFAAIAALAVVATTRLALTRGKRLADTQADLIRAKDSQLALDLKAKDEKIADAKKLAGEAQRTAESEGLKRAQIEAQLAWRTISVEQDAKFRAAIPGALSPKLKVSMMVVAGDAEGTIYAEGIAKLLHKVGLSVDFPRAALFVGILPEGVIIRVPDQQTLGGEAGLTLHQAFKAAGIDAPEVMIPEIAADSIQIIVGVKPHPSTGKK